MGPARRREWLRAISGMLSVVFGVLLVVCPAAGAFTLVTLIGAAALVMGLTFLAFSFRMRRRRADNVPTAGHYGRATA